MVPFICWELHADLSPLQINIEIIDPLNPFLVAGFPAKNTHCKGALLHSHQATGVSFCLRGTTPTNNMRCY